MQRERRIRQTTWDRLAVHRQRRTEPAQHDRFRCAAGEDESDDGEAVVIGFDTRARGEIEQRRRRRDGRDFVNGGNRPATTVAESVEFARCVCPDADEARAKRTRVHSDPQLLNLPRREVTVKKPAQAGRRAKVIAEDISSAQSRDRAPAIDESANHRNAIAVIVLENGIDERGVGIRIGRDGPVGVIEEASFLPPPTVVPSRLHDIDFLDRVLPDVSHEQPIRHGIKAETIGIPKTVSVNFIEPRHADERIAGRNAIPAVRADRIGAARILRGRERIDAQDFAEKIRRVLAVADIRRVAVAGVAAATAVAAPDVEISVARAEGDFPRVVIRLRMGETKHIAARCRISEIGIARRNLPLRHDTAAVRTARHRHEEVRHPTGRLRGVGVKPAKARTRRITEPRVKGESQKSLLAARRNLPADVQERCAVHLPVLKDFYLARLLDDE